MLENIRLSFQGIWSHKMRSFLTMLGIIIGIAAIIAIVSTIKGTNEQIKNNLIGSGNNIVKVSLYQDSWEYEFDYNGIPDGVPVITDDTLEQIEESQYVEAAALYNSRQDYEGIIYYGTTKLSSSMILGVSENYLSVADYQLTQGRGFCDKDYSTFATNVILDSVAADQLFAGEDPIGKLIEIKGQPFCVIGVVQEKSESKAVITSLDDYWTYADDSSVPYVFIPSSTWPEIYNFDEPQNMIVKAVSTDDMTNAGKAATDILNTYLTVSDDTIKYKADDALEQAKEIQELSASTNNQLIWIASISLLVGGIGVMNIMLVSVTERTKEIGLKKAIGAKKRRILAQFLTEAAVLTSIGGILGVLVGIGLAQLISKVADTPVAISVPAAVIAVVFSMVIGILFGLLPSIKAANMNPIEALRRE